MPLLTKNVGGKLKSKTTRRLEPFKVENKLARKDRRSLRKTIRSECSAVRDQEKPRLRSHFHGHFLFSFKIPL